MPFSCAIRSALSPMVSPVVGSFSAGGVGVKSFGRRPARTRARSASVRARLSSTSACASGREAKMGASETDSAPPAIAQSEWPSRIWSAASVAAWIEVAQARATVWACTLRGSWVRSTISRPMSVTVGEGMTWPKMTESNAFGGSPLRATSSFTTSAPRSVAERSLKSVPAFTNGVRRPATTAARRPGGGEPFMPMSAAPVDLGIGRLPGQM
jgi:hypothetical protein